MASRRLLLLLSIFIGIVVHLGILAAAPRIQLFKPHAELAEVRKAIRLDLYQELFVPGPVAREQDISEEDGAPGPDDVLGEQDELLEPEASLLARAVAIPLLDERVAMEEMERGFDLEQDAANIERVDTRIVEIAENEARNDIDIARRLVTPSTPNILPEEVMPTLRGSEVEIFGDEVLHVPVTGAGGGGAGDGGSEQAVAFMEAPERPKFEEDVFDIEAFDPGLPDLPDEVEIARAPLLEEVLGESQYQFMDDLVNIEIKTYQPSGSDEAFFELKIVPKQNEEQEVLPKDITFVVDSSKSIHQRKLKRVAEGISRALDMLTDRDHFNILVFRDTQTSFRPTRVPATPENKADGRRFLEGLEAKGETDMYEAVRPMVEESPRKGVPSIVMVMTDGRPTTGVVDARTIINSLTDENTKGNTIFAYGGGATVNRYLLDLIAYRNKGESYFTPDLTNIEGDIPKYLARLQDPLLVNLEGDYGRLDETNIFPQAIPDFYRDKAVTIYGKFDPKKEDEFSVRLVGEYETQDKEMIFRSKLGEGSKGGEDIARNWAFQKIYYLIGEICRVGEKPELLAELRDLSKKYGIKTSYDQ